MERIFLIVLLLICGTFTTLQAQQRPQPFTQKELTQDIDLRLPDPGKAALFSAVLPGLGQVYNKSYWKVPIIYGAAVGLGYAIKYNNTYYQQFREDLLLAHNGQDVVNFPQVGNNKERLGYYTDYYRRNRDLLYILGGVLYLLNIVDAHVDAHLQEFKMFDNMNMSVQPTMINGGEFYTRDQNTVGVQLKMDIPY
jgi:hypothetical protein